MSAQGLETIDRSAQITHEWINELTERLSWSSKRSALHLFRVVLHHIRDHLLPDEMAQMSAQLPMMIRGMFFEGWVPKRVPVKERSAAEFIKSIEAEVMQSDDYRGPEDIFCVFDLLNTKLSAGEIEDVRANLPSAIRALWPAP